MKIRLTLIVLLIASLLTGCSVLEQVNTTISYATEATDFINDANRFADQVPLLAEQALMDPEAIDALKAELLSMKDRIAAFNALEAPAFAEEIHGQLLAYNETLQMQIDEYLEQIKQSTIDLEALSNARILETVRNMASLLSQIEQLGQ